MSIGPTVRRMLGPIEAPISSAYRSMFINVGELGKAIDAVPFGSRVLEVGVGDGMIASQIIERRPDTSVLGIDLAENPGSLFGGDRSRAEFRTISTSDLLAEQPTPFDAIVIADVLHHVPPSLRTGLLDDVATLLSDDGVLLVKETIVVKSPGYWMGRFSDRWITGDRNVSFLREADLKRLIADNVPNLVACGRSTIRPWKTNLLLVWRRETH
ncbi:MAG: class I SAM-dependent methyltransferase [Actinomycetota bacterium]